MFRLEAVRRLLHLAVPMILSQAAMFAMILIDTYMIAPLGSGPLAGVGLGSLLFFTYFAIAVGVLSTLEVFVSTAFGRGDEKSASAWLGQGIGFALVLAGGGFVLLRVASNLLEAFGVETQVASFTQAYMKSLAHCLLPYSLFVVLRQYLAALHRVQFTLAVLIAALALNPVLNWILIYGNLGVAPMGVFGAGLATVFTRWGMLAALASYYGWHLVKQTPYFQWPSAEKGFLSQSRRFLSVGFPIGAQAFVRAAYFLLAGVWIAGLGPDAMAAHTICTNLGSFFYMIPIGMAGATAVWVGKANGSRDVVLVNEMTLTSLGVGALMAGILAVGMIQFRFPLIELLSQNTEVITVGATLILLLGLLQLFDFLQTIATGALRGLAQTRGPFLANLAALWCVGIPLAYYLGPFSDGNVISIWLGLLSGLACLAILVLVQVRKRCLPPSVHFDPGISAS